MANLTGRWAMLLVVAMTAAGPVGAQDRGVAAEAYGRAVSDFFQVPRDEVAILGDWDLPAQEIPVALFVATRAGVSPEALVALRSSGWSWADLARRYHLDASHFHVPLARNADAGVLSDAYDSFRSLEPRQWRTLDLDDRELVALVNLRLLSQTLRVPAEEVLAQASSSASWVEVYGALLRQRPGPPGRR